MYNIPQLSFDKQRKVFVFNTKNNEFLEYLSLDDALFVNSVIYYDFLLTFDNAGFIDMKVIEQIVFIGEQYALEILKYGSSIKDQAEEYLLDHLKAMNLPINKFFISYFIFQFKGINIIINSELKKTSKFKKESINKLLVKYRSTLEYL